MDASIGPFGPDRSTVEIYIWPWETRYDLQGEEVGAMLEEHGIDAVSVMNVSGDPGLEVELEDLEDGTRRLRIFHQAVVDGAHGDSWWSTLAAAARRTGLAYLLLDGGHHSWDSSQEFWLPGLQEPVSRPALIDGAPVIRLHDLAHMLATAPSYGELIQNLARLVATRDPLSWRPGTNPHLTDHAITA